MTNHNMQANYQTIKKLNFKNAYLLLNFLHSIYNVLKYVLITLKIVYIKKYNIFYFNGGFGFDLLSEKI